MPVKLLIGQLPTVALRRKHGLSCYEDVTEAVRGGNLQLFEQAMVEHYDLFVRSG